MHHNIEMLIAAVRRLGPLVKEVVFVGGSTTGLFITDPLSTGVRATHDVDVIVEATTRPDYYRFLERLRAQGFQEVVDDPVICQEVAQASVQIRSYLSGAFAQLLDDDDFLDALPGHLPPDPASQQRRTVVEQRMQTIRDANTSSKHPPR